MKKEKNANIRRKKNIRYDEAGLPRRMLELLALTLFATLLVEGFNQDSVTRMLDYLLDRTIYFIFNCLVVFATLSLTEIFRPRRALALTITTLWIILGFANLLVCRDRTQPLVSGDMIFTREILGLTTQYFGWPLIIACFILCLLIIFGLVTMFARMPKRRKINYPRAMGGVLSIMCCVFFACVLSVKAGLIPVHFDDRVSAYRDYGFTTCFSLTFFKSGVDEPKAYSGETVTQILDEIEEPAPTLSPAKRFGADDNLRQPNILFVQLESFMDMEDIIGAEYSKDPTPNYHKLLEENPNGLLYVPTIGGGTANVEFEIMTGLNMDFFAAGEAPFNTVLEETTCESIAHNLRKNGYYTSTLHNNTGFFFSRNRVYSNLGFDRFDSLEYMLYPDYDARGWADDNVLIDEIKTIMDSTEQRDLVFAVSVESHGKYPDTYEPADGDIIITSYPEKAYLPNSQHYINLIDGVDVFIGRLIEELERYDEPILAVFYGDHLPALGLEAEMLSTGDLYASRYILWNNYGAEFEAPDLQSYRLVAEILRQMGISDGVMTKFHQAHSLAESGSEYMEKFQTLQYDLLFGEKNAYGEAGPYEPSDIAYGAGDITARSAVIEYGRLLVKGDRFTEYSKVAAGDQLLETLFVDHQTLAAVLPDTETDLSSIAVAQINSDGKEMGRTPPCKVTQ